MVSINACINCCGVSKVKNAKQLWLGLALLVFGIIMVVALIKKPTDIPPQNQEVEEVAEVVRLTEPLTADMQTEERILAQRQKEREARVREAERESQALLKEQEAARTMASKKAEREQEAFEQAQLVVQTRPESQALAQEHKRQEELRIRRERERKEQAATTQKQPEPTNPARHTVVSGDTLTRLSRHYGIPVAVLASANNLKPTDGLQRGRTLKIPSASEIRTLEAKAAAAQKEEAYTQVMKQKQQALEQKLADARREAKQQGVNERYSVQVALASNQENADEVAKQYRAAGYRVNTVQSGQGVRVVLGPERTRDAALLLREKVNNDPSVKASGAWVLQVK